ncbi:LPS-assembly protein [Isorropodon fossajaponicum endosymbiont JTNG4]|uniref:LPS-assembly protein LptD n=1 Tax=Isorropodon fossajaponicum symbiont TaxID=883811 RepID=UPI001934EA25|nr:LPS assembly protein LptD [Isorropodon fossajaponicum symbiont]BBB24225.1 LPS-assembly protein [Isorropodon fossajaponicum endosymbiont JTNG4]
MRKYTTIMKKQLALYSLFTLLSSTISAESLVLNCQNNALLFPKQILSDKTKDLDVQADYSEVVKGGNYLLKGNVSLNSSAYFLSADEISINKSSKISSSTGHVKFQDNELMLIGDKAVVEKQGEVTHTTLNQVKFHYPNSRINGRAQVVTNDGTKQVFSSGSYSLCPLGNSDWQMKADKITLNSSTNKGVAENVIIEFLGMPIFYSPHHEWALEGRGSGFLAPAFGSYNESGVNKDNNYQVRIPYYFNIAPDRDFLLTLNQLSSRGSVLEGKYRQLITNNNYLGDGHFEIEGHYLNKDKITNNRRWLLNSKLDLSLNAKTDLSIVTNRVSDSDYFKEIAHSNTSDSELQSHVNLSYQDQKQNLTMSLFSESEQLINNGSASYTRAPELSINKGYKGLGGRHVNLSLVSTKFTHKNSNTTANKTGVRTYAQAKFSRSLRTNNYSLTPSLNLSMTDYTMDDVANQKRNIASFNLDSKLFLERKISSFGTNLTQTLTPRLAYNYTPKKDQSALPNFDSDDKNDSYEGLFSGQKFTGIDRIASANDLTFGLESDFIDEETGDTYLSLKMAQAYRFDDIGMNSNGALVSQRKYSDITMSTNLTMRDFSFNNSLQYNPKTNKISKRNSSVSYILNPRRFLTLAHHDDNGKKSAELYGAYPLTKKIHVFAGINRSISDSISNKETTGITYESCCWAVRLAHFKEHVSGNDYDYVTKFELVLKGLATTSSSLYKRLEENVPNYLANLDDF